MEPTGKMRRGNKRALARFYTRRVPGIDFTKCEPKLKAFVQEAQLFL